MTARIPSSKVRMRWWTLTHNTSPSRCSPSATLLLVVSLPSLVNDVGMNCIRIFHRHLQIGEGEFWRIGEDGHSLVPVRAGQADTVPIAMDVRWHIAQVGNRAVEHPGAAAVGIGRVTTI